MDLWRYIKDKMIENAGRTISEKDASMTYEEMIVYAEIIAAKLASGEERCCAIYCRSEMASAMGILGCIAAGVTALPLSFEYGSLHAKKILNNISPTCLITDLAGDLGIFTISDSKYVSPEPFPSFIIHATGSSVMSKGVSLSSSAVISKLEDVSKYYRITSQDSALILRPLYHGEVLIGEFLTSLIKGAKIAFFSESLDFSAALYEIEKKNITAIGGTPESIGALAGSSLKKIGASLKHVVINGDRLSADEGAKIRTFFSKAKIYHVYGLAEAASIV